MAGLNKIQIIGNLGRDPEMRFTPQGTAVTSFTVAVNRKWGGGEDGKNEETIWFRVSAWNRLAEICNEYLSKGKQVYIEGRIRQPQIFTDRNGAVRASLEMTATDMVMLGSRGDSDYSSNYGDDYDDTTGDEPSTPSREGKDTPAPRNKPQPITSDENDDEIPF
jgi:single-strand DNA-binding protein